ncbi:Class i alpha-mannosidase protein [Neofusicoccum parvum]|uniref:Class i alpha-mannosidase protein n=1 Tax=Neofusicoccum parvum TaxID=310453 RepID=A0ACB5SAH0_9PEZI|nr:Class i alpha-mannosidase protein [Neofusicoccum parvum]
MLLSTLSLRKLLFPCTAFLAISLIVFHSLPLSYRVVPGPLSALAGGASQFADPSDGKFHWSKVAQRHPVESLIPLPTGVTEIPRIQHDFAPESEEARRVRLERLKAVKSEFLHAWTGYKEHAWLKDEVAPLSGGTQDAFGGWAATLVDSLDTLWIMGLEDEFAAAAAAAVAALDLSACSLPALNVFETTIRHLGGLLAAHDLSGREDLLRKAWQLGTMLLAAFDTPNRMPVTRWDFRRAAGGGGNDGPSDAALSAELGSLVLELTRLAQATGDARFFDAGQRVADAFAASQGATRLPGMWPIAVNARDLENFANGWNLFTIGGMADSLYEYLPKMHALLGGATVQYREMFEQAARVMKEHMFYRPVARAEGDMLVVGDVVAEEGGVRLDPKNQHLACFAGGMFGIAGKMFDNPDDVEVGRKLTEGCLWAYETNPNGIMPEVMHTVPCEDAANCAWDEQKWLEAVERAYSQDGNSVDPRAVVDEKHLREGVAKIDDARYILRPEAIESIFILYRITGDETLRERAWNMFSKIIQFTRTDIAHAGLDDCVTDDPPKSDRMESFWTAETLKYFYLLFSEPDVVSLDEYVLNTEAHPLRRPT